MATLQRTWFRPDPHPPIGAVLQQPEIFVVIPWCLHPVQSPFWAWPVSLRGDVARNKELPSHPSHLCESQRFPSLKTGSCCFAPLFSPCLLLHPLENQVLLLRESTRRDPAGVLPARPHHPFQLGHREGAHRGRSVRTPWSVSEDRGSRPGPHPCWNESAGPPLA